MTEKKTNALTSRSLKMFTGAFDMKMHDQNDPIAVSATMGRACANCHGFLQSDYVVFPSKHEIYVFCGDCVRSWVGVSPEEVAPPQENVAMAVSTLSRILEDTSA